MNFDNNEWDLADKHLNNWLNEDKDESSHQLIDILKSTYLTFRQKQKVRIGNFCKQAFEYYQEQQINIAHELINEQEYKYESHSICFRRVELSESEKKERNLKENHKIITGILSGDQQVLNDLYEDEFPKTVKLVILNSGNLDSAKDIFQDALVLLIEKVYAKKLNLTCSVKTYLYSICRLMWMDRLRQNKREVSLNDSYYYINADITVDGYEDTPNIYENVNAAIETLGDPCKQLLECFYYKNQSWDEIASSLGYTNAASARNQKYKCLERVRKIVGVEN